MHSRLVQKLSDLYTRYAYIFELYKLEFDPRCIALGCFELSHRRGSIESRILDCMIHLGCLVESNHLGKRGET
jgi:hypothetical protein